MSIWEYIILFSSVLLGGGVAFYFQKNNKTYLKLALSFSGAYILGITVLHLLPIVFAQSSHSIGLWILLGFFIQLFLEFLSQGLEHGHIHADHHQGSNFAIPIMLGLCIHAFLEGMPLSNYNEVHDNLHGHGHDHSSHNHLFFGIIIHKAPAAFTLVLLLLFSHIKKSKILIYLTLFASMSPLGALLSSTLQQQGLLDTQNQVILLAIVIGSFLHISTTILFEMEENHHKISFPRLTAIIVGVVFALMTMH